MRTQPARDIRCSPEYVSFPSLSAGLQGSMYLSDNEIGEEMPMMDHTIIYGDIVDHVERQKLKDAYGSQVSSRTWKDSPAPVEPTNSSSIVFVDLDDPRFCSAEFLVSVATSGKQVKLIGKSDKSNQAEITRWAKLGVSEILTSDQCLQRLDDLLNELEGIGQERSEGSSKLLTSALIGVSEQTSEIRHFINTLSSVDFPSALLLGETGTGKSLVSRILHNSGTRSDHNLVEVNCSAIVDDLFESELFGHVKGAFTDAKADKKGLFEYAQNGTLFLDEIGNLSPAAQAKLLKVLEDKKLRKVGSVNDKDINVRVVAATNIDLKTAIKEGLFREDLYYRLNLLTITIPPLRERPEDIPDLIDYYLGYYTTNYGKPGLEMDKKCIEPLQQYNWPGNIRELCNVIEKAVLLCRDERIRAHDLGIALEKGRLSIADRQQITIDVPTQGVSLDYVVQNVVKQVLNMCNWNKSEAAKFLKISRPRLRRIIGSAQVEQDKRQN